MGLGLASSSRLNLRLRRVRPPNHQGAGWPGVGPSREGLRGLHRVTGWVPLGAVALMADGGGSAAKLEAFEAAGIDLDALAATLQTQAADWFVKAWDDLMAHIDEQTASLVG